MNRETLRRNEHGLAALALALLLNVLFFPYVWGNLNLMNGANDVPSVTELGGPNGNPARPVDQSRWKLLDANGSGRIDEPTFPLVHHQLFVEHEIPLWNPDMAFGMPLAAAMQEQPFYPLTSVVMLAPGPTTFAAYILLRLFVAGFSTYLFLRFFVGFLPALGGGIAFMLNGYFFLYGTMPHLSVETLTGALFLGVELVLRQRRPWLAVPFLAVVVWFDFLGGMPESSFINIVFASLYGVFRVLTVSAYRSAWFLRLRDFSIAMACGFACASFLLLPFAEFVVNSFNVHEASKNGGTYPALVPEPSPQTSLAIYLMPMLFGPPWEAPDVNVYDGYFGVTLVFCAVAAAAYAILCRRSGLAAPIAFFAAAVIVLTAKRFSLPAVNWIGELPIVRVIALGKYQEVATAFAIAALVAFGLHALFVNPQRRRWIGFGAFIATLAALQAASVFAGSLTDPAQPRAAAYFFLVLGGGLLALTTFAAIAARAALHAAASHERLYAGLAVLAITTELSLNYFVPMYYFVDPGPAKIQNPYLGAPYLDYLHSVTHVNGERIYAEKTPVLTTNWAQAFDLRDVRDYNALYDDHYLPFYRAFTPKADHTDITEDFSGSGDYTMATPLGQKLLALGSVGYVISDDMLDPTSLGARIERRIASSNDAAGTVAVGLKRFGMQSLDGFAQTPASPALTLPFGVPKNVRSIAAALAVQKTFWALPAGRIEFHVEISDSRGTSRTLLSRRLDSRIGGAGGVFHEELDVRRYAGTPVRLAFSIRANHAAAAVAGFWGDLRAEKVPGEPSPFALARHYSDTNIFSFAHPLPHGALYDHVTVAGDDASALNALIDPAFDVFGGAIVSGNSIPPSLTRAVADLSRQPPAPVRAATLEASSATDVSYGTDAKKPTLLFLSDTLYPGWKAFVDARATPILRTNYLFRGVIVPAGKHTVEFRYDPLTFRAGLALCICGLLALLAFSVHSRRTAEFTSWRLGKAARDEA